MKCIKYKVTTIEAKKFLEEETVTEVVNYAPTINDNNSEADLVRWICSKFSLNNFLMVLYEFALVYKTTVIWNSTLRCTCILLVTVSLSKVICVAYNYVVMYLRNS